MNGIVTGYSELPKEGETEIWEIINLTADAHPIHLHLVQFQLMSRQKLDTKKYPAAYAAAYGGVVVDSYGPPRDYNVPNADGAVGGNPAVLPFLKGALKPPNANETGWKDTVMMFPGQVTRIVVRWAPTKYPATTPALAASYDFDPNGGHGYVWHCHIVDHEDNEMMRPTNVIPIPGAPRTYVQGVDLPQVARRTHAKQAVSRFRFPRHRAALLRRRGSHLPTPPRAEFGLVVEVIFGRVIPAFPSYARCSGA